MAEDLEKLWSKLSFTEEEDEGIELGSNCTNAARAVGRNCLVMKICTSRCVSLDALRKNMRMLWKPSGGVQISEIENELFLAEFGEDCHEGWAEKSRLDEGSLQYGAWLRGDTWRRNGWISTLVGTGRENGPKKKVTGECSEKLTNRSWLTVTDDGSSKDQVQVTSGMESNTSLGVEAMSEKLKGVEEVFHELGKVDRETRKVEEKATCSCEMSLGTEITQTVAGASMQWEGSKSQMGEPKFVKDLAPNFSQTQRNLMTTAFEETLQKIDEEIGLNTEKEEREDLVSIPESTTAPFEILVARNATSHINPTQLVKPEGKAQPIGSILLSDSVESPPEKKKGKSTGSKPKEQGTWIGQGSGNGFMVAKVPFGAGTSHFRFSIRSLPFMDVL
nr:hypothetical protein CFP56_68483 [Quercus suber]